MVGKELSHYKILDKLGKGGMGVVYRALDTRLQRHVALKMLPPEFGADENRRKRLMAEARAASILSHPNICTIHEIDEEEGILFVVMEYLEGHTLQEEVSQGPLNMEKLIRIAIQIGEGLEKAHSRNIIHRDIKPSNILVTDEGRAKILDFGLARVAKEIDEELLSRATTTDGSLTKTGKVVGTIHYMSPEQISGGKVDPRTDIFSFGVLLFEMCTGTMPFQGESVYEIMSSILKSKPASVSSLNKMVPLDLDRIIVKALSKDPGQRYLSMKEMLADLRKVHEKPKSDETSNQSIAVLYFENLSTEKEQEYFRDGMTEDVITELSKIENLRVFPRSTMRAYRDQPASATDIGSLLNARYVLDGSLRRATNRIRITAQLVEVETGHSIWAERYDRQVEDVFDLQDEIAKSIASALKIRLSPQEKKAIESKPTENPQAYDYFLRGRSFARRCTRPDLDFAIEMFEHAIQLDPRFALAYASLSSVQALYYHWHGHDLNKLEAAKQAADHALSLDPDLPEGLVARARILWVQEKHDQAADYAKRAIKRKPECEGAYWVLGQALFNSDRCQEALELAPFALEMSGDDYNVYVPYVGSARRLNLLETVQQLRNGWLKALFRQLEWVPEDVRARMFVAGNYAELGKKAEAIRELEKALSLRPDDTTMLYNAACVYGILSRKTEALAALKKALDAGFQNISWLEIDPDLASVRDDPEFRRLIEEAKAKQEKDKEKGSSV